MNDIEQQVREEIKKFINLRWKEKLRWFINLRWIACVGVFIVITCAKYILKIDLVLLPLYLGNILLIFCNTLFFLYNKQIDKRNDEQFL